MDLVACPECGGEVIPIKYTQGKGKRYGGR